MSFSWLTTIWSGAAMTAMLLAMMQLVLWFEGERRPVVLLALVMAVGAGADAVIELALMNASSIETYATLARFQNLAIYLLLVPMVWFVHLQLASRRRWLAIAISALWSVCLVINFSVSGSLTFAEVHAIEPLHTFWGETFTSHEATESPFKWMADVAGLLIIVFVADAMIHAWRAGNRHKAITIGGSVLLFMVTALLHTVLVDADYLATPYMISLAFVAIVMALSYDVVRDAARSSRYALRLRRDERRWTMLLNSVQLAVMRIDNEDRVSYVNPFYLATTGIPVERLRGVPSAQLFAPGSLPVVHLSADDAAHHIQVIRRPVRCTTGAVRTLDWRQVELETEDGRADGMLLIGLDVSEQLRADQELARTRHELERVARATTLGEISAALAHELNQPLAAILSNAQAALRFLKWDPPDHAEVERILVDIVRDDARAADVIKRLRSLLRNDPIEPDLLALNDAISEAAAIMAPELSARDATLHMSLGQQLPAVLAGRIEMQQVVINLLLNALQAMDGLPVEQRIIHLSSEHSEGEVRLVVRDHGPGIDQQRRQQVFAPFATTRSGGLGMGLAICRRIVESHGARIEVDNHPDGGARVTVTLPAQLANGMAKRA